MNIAIIPARGGSKRIPRKNIKEFCGQPMIAWSIQAAIKSNCFDKIIVSTDDEEIAEVARTYGAEDQGAGLLGGAFIGAVRVDWLEQLAKAIRAEALEEAAKVCEQGTGDAVQTDVLKALWKERERIAEVIRGLK